MNKRIETIKKLRRMAQQGTENERAIALKKMDALIRKYGINESEIDEDVMKEYGFSYKDKYEKQILIQVMAMVAGDREIHIYNYKHGKGSRSQLFAECTSEEAIQMEIAYEFYLDAWNEDVETFMNAFIQTNRIFPNKRRSKNEEEPSLEELEKIQRMMNGIDARTLNPLIEEVQEGER